jgi:DNA-binding PadR family transcriptional regulator
MPKRKARPTVESFLPLSSTTFYILLALTEGERHGYAIMQEVASATNGSVRLGPGTLYGALQRLLDGGIVTECERPDPHRDDERRRYYRLTDFGRALARAEARRLGGLVRVAREKKLIGVRLA